MGLRSEEAAAVGEAEFWGGFENRHVVQDHCKSFSHFNFLVSESRRRVGSHMAARAAELLDSILKPFFKHSNHSLYLHH